MRINGFGFVFLGLVVLGFLSGMATAQAPIVPVADGPEPPSFLGYVQNEIVVELTPAAAARANRSANATNRLEALSEFAPVLARLGVDRARNQFAGASQTSGNRHDRRLARFFTVRFSGTLDDAVAEFSRHPLVAHAEPIGIHALRATPNDTYWTPTSQFPDALWHLEGGAGVNAESAWDDASGDSSVVVGILDSGVRYFHTDLGGPNTAWGPSNPQTNGNIWINGSEIAGNGVDDDGNGFVDDTVGYDFVSSTEELFVTCIDDDCGGIDNDPRDTNGHGTHVAGIVGGITNNARGVAGVAGGFASGSTGSPGNGVKILPLRIGWHARYFGIETGIVRMDYAAQAMYYVAGLVDAGVNVAAINCSWGSSNSGGIDAAVDALLARDVMIMNAAGNSNANDPEYLGAKAGVMSVGASDVNGAAADFSNYGSWVDLAAPGVDILSTYHLASDPANDYVALLSGTSMAAPNAAGVAALLESLDPSLSGPDKFTLMVNTALPYSGGKDVGSGIVNARAAFDAIGPACDVTAAFDADSTQGCPSHTVNFTDLSTGPVTSWSWDFGDGGSSNAASPSHTYTAPGTYTVSLTVTSATCSDSETKSGLITVLDTPVADFEATPTSGSAPMNVQFTDTSTGSPSSWSWEFGDGDTSVLQHPSHTYDTPGTYSVSLTVTSGCGTDSTTMTDLVSVMEAPPSQFIFASSETTVSGTVQGNLSATFASDDSYEVITEGESNGKPSDRYSLAEHRWTFQVPPGDSVRLHMEASRTANAENDNFRVQYSTDGQNFTQIFSIVSHVEASYDIPLPNFLSGTVYIRVIDTDRTSTRNVLDSLFVDFLAIESSANGDAMPTISIDSPSSGTSFDSGATIALAGSADDFEDGDLSSTIEWSSDIDGDLGTGASLDVVLTDGTHAITASVMDSAGQTSTDTIFVTVADGTPPPPGGETLQVSVGTDKAVYANRETVLITVVVTDSLGGVPGATVDVELTTPKGKTKTASGVTDIFGLVLFQDSANSKRDGVGTYNLNAAASAPGYSDGAGSTTYEVVD